MRSVQGSWRRPRITWVYLYLDVSLMRRGPGFLCILRAPATCRIWQGVGSGTWPSAILGLIVPVLSTRDRTIVRYWRYIVYSGLVHGIDRAVLSGQREKRDWSYRVEFHLTADWHQLSFMYLWVGISRGKLGDENPEKRKRVSGRVDVIVW